MCSTLCICRKATRRRARCGQRVPSGCASLAGPGDQPRGPGECQHQLARGSWNSAFTSWVDPKFLVRYSTPLNVAMFGTWVCVAMYFF